VIKREERAYHAIIVAQVDRETALDQNKCLITFQRMADGGYIDWTLGTIQQLADDLVMWVGGPSFTVEYCFVGDSGDNSDRCGFHYSAPIMIMVCLCTLLITIIIGWVALKHRQYTLAVLGDAVATSLKG
jgi:hypothetical protein